MVAADRARARRRRGTRYRTWVHVGLIGTAAVSLSLEPVLAVHILVGLAFVALVGGHLVQRRQVSGNLARRLLRPHAAVGSRATRMALADLVLLLVTVAMLGSGLWDWAIGHPTRIRWHALTGFALAVLLVGHTLRRSRRLTSSQVR